MSIWIKEYKPSEPLRPFVELYSEGHFNINDSGRWSSQMIPNGYLELIFHLNNPHCELPSDNQWSQSPDYMIVGLFTQSHEIQFRSIVKVFSIRLKPEALYSLFKIPASIFSNCYEDITMVLGSEFRDFAHRIREEKDIQAMIVRAESYLLKKMVDNKIDTGYINTAAELIRTTTSISIKDIADRVCISQRQLEREFKDKVGIGPKHYLRITRINEVLNLLRNGQEFDLTNVAYQCGYFDQAHFIKDFKKIIGVNPGIFIKEKEQTIEKPRRPHSANTY